MEELIDKYNKLNDMEVELRNQKLKLAKQYYEEAYPALQVGNIVAAQACKNCPTRFHIIKSITVDESSFPLSKKNIIEHQFGLKIITCDVKSNISTKDGWIYIWEDAIKICHVDEFENVMKENNIRGKKLIAANLLKLKEKLNLNFIWH